MNENTIPEEKNYVKAGRDITIDKAKMGMLLLVVLGHVLVFFSSEYGSLFDINSGNYENNINIILDVIYSFHMPAFFILSGIIYDKNKNYFKFMLRNIKKLVIPSVIFMILVMIPILKYVGEYKEVEFITWFDNIHNRHLWFIESLVIMLFVNRTLDLIPGMKLFKLILSVVLYYLTMDKIVVIKPISIANYMIYFQLGEVLGKDSFKINIPTLIIYLSMAVGINYALISWNNSGVVKYIENNNTFYVLNSLLLTITAYKIFELVPYRLCKHQFNVYLFHAPIIYLLMTKLRYIELGNPVNKILVVFILTLLISFLISTILKLLFSKCRYILSKITNLNMFNIESKLQIVRKEFC